MKNKKTFVSIVALVCLVSLLLCGCSVKLPFGNKPSTGDEKTFTLQIVHSDGISTEQEITTTQNYLANALFDEKILVEEDALNTGMYTIVDGEEASWEKDQAYWGFFVNGDFAVAGLNDTPIEDGAIYKLEYSIGGW